MILYDIVLYIILCVIHPHLIPIFSEFSTAPSVSPGVRSARPGSSAASAPQRRPPPRPTAAPCRSNSAYEWAVDTGRVDQKKHVIIYKWMITPITMVYGIYNYTYWGL